jgi:hypothetical protein
MSADSASMFVGIAEFLLPRECRKLAGEIPSASLRVYPELHLIRWNLDCLWYQRAPCEND